MGRTWQKGVNTAETNSLMMIQTSLSLHMCLRVLLGHEPKKQSQKSFLFTLKFYFSTPGPFTHGLKFLTEICSNGTNIHRQLSCPFAHSDKTRCCQTDTSKVVQNVPFHQHLTNSACFSSESKTCTLETKTCFRHTVLKREPKCTDSLGSCRGPSAAVMLVGAQSGAQTLQFSHWVEQDSGISANRSSSESTFCEQLIALIQFSSWVHTLWHTVDLQSALIACTKCNMLAWPIKYRNKNKFINKFIPQQQQNKPQRQLAHFR